MLKAGAMALWEAGMGHIAAMEWPAGKVYRAMRAKVP
jgi:hypothetical protein